jgi:RimJ/RimL family protein N-acetyltransferase
MSGKIVSKYETRRTTLDDLRVLVTNTPEANLWGYMQEQHVSYLLNQDSWSGFVDGGFVACGGLVNIWPGLAEAWIAVTPQAHQHTAFILRTAKLYLDDRITRYGLRRIEAHIRADFHIAERFCYWLGFKFDAFLPKYGPNGEPFLLMSRVV